MVTPMLDEIVRQQSVAADLIRNLASMVRADLKPPPEESEAVLPPVSDLSELPAAVTCIRKGKMKAHVIRRGIATATQGTLEEAGSFVRGDDERSYYIHRQSRILYDLASERFKNFLAGASGLNPVETEFSFVLAHLQIHASSLDARQIRILSHYDRRKKAFYFYDGQGGVFLCENGEWASVDNGH